MKECLEEATIQAYVDGELSPSSAERAATHVAVCAACAAAVREVEDELSLLTTAFEPELSLAVPSARLRERLDAAISELRPPQNARANVSGWNFKNWLASLSGAFNFAPGHAIGFASLLAVVALAVLFAMITLRRDANPPALLAAVNDAGHEGINPPALAVKGNLGEGQPEKIDGPGNVIVPVKYNAPRPRVNAMTARRTTNPVRPEERTIDNPLPGELSYLKILASLTNVVEANGENSLKPSLRAEYERNLALVDHAIASTRRTARLNPKNQDAAEFLYSSYQSKIDLLSTVAEQGQMVAAIR
ncbi:MAG TPA: zf-HC2 domain-containing protein [Pyrinomonadaceae bacterium]|jgi:hypothetical protein